MLKQFFSVVAAFTLALVLANVPLAAQDAKMIQLPAGTQAAGYIDVEGLRKSPVGRKLVEKVADRILSGVAANVGVNQPSPEDIAKIFGINPVEELRSIAFAVTDVDNPGANVVTMARLYQSLGSAKGVLSALSVDYAEETIGGYEFHSLNVQGLEAVEGDRKVHATVYTDADGFHTVVAGPNQELVKTQLAKLDPNFTEVAPSESFEFQPTTGALADIRVLELPSAEALGESPLSLFTHLLTSLSVQFKDENNQIDLSIKLNASDEDAAGQLSQLLQSLAPALQGPLAELSEEGLKILHEGQTVTVSVAGDSTKAADLVSQQFDLAVGLIESTLTN